MRLVQAVKSVQLLLRKKENVHCLDFNFSNGWNRFLRFNIEFAQQTKKSVKCCRFQNCRSFIGCFLREFLKQIYGKFSLRISLNIGQIPC